MLETSSFKFEKYSGLCNDFILTGDILFNQTIDFSTLQQLSVKICNRHAGVGADGIIYLTTTETANSFKMKILNADGSIAAMCGNALRCIAKFLFLHKIIKENEQFLILTDNGEKKAIVKENGNLISIEMGNISGINFEQECIQLENETFEGYFIEFGVPHFVILVPDIKEEFLKHYGPLIEKHANFPNGTNVDFVKKISSSEIKVRTYERGCGETMACGTGACSAVITGILLKQLDESVQNQIDYQFLQVKVNFPGGCLQIKWNGNKKDSIILIGPAEFVFLGTYYFRPKS